MGMETKFVRLLTLGFRPLRVKQSRPCILPRQSVPLLISSESSRALLRDFFPPYDSPSGIEPLKSTGVHSVDKFKPDRSLRARTCTRLNPLVLRREVRSELHLHQLSKKRLRRRSWPPLRRPDLPFQR